MVEFQATFLFGYNNAVQCRTVNLAFKMKELSKYIGLVLIVVGIIIGMSIYNKLTGYETSTLGELGLYGKQWTNEEAALAAKATYGRLTQIYQPLFEEAQKSGTLGDFYKNYGQEHHELGMQWLTQKNEEINRRYKYCILAWSNQSKIVSELKMYPHWDYYLYNVEQCKKSF